MWGHYRSKIMGVFSRPLNEASSSTSISFDDIGLLSMENSLMV
jgi:hypothetical protein